MVRCTRFDISSSSSPGEQKDKWQPLTTTFASKKVTARSRRLPDSSRTDAHMTKTVLSPSLGLGPKGLGDPDDRRLRKVETEINIPQIMRDRARVEKCSAEGAAFSECCKATGLLMTFKCRQETNEYKSCIKKWYDDDDFKRECTEQYLESRRIYRLTGEKAPTRAAKPVLM